MFAVVASADGTLSAQAAQQKGRPVVLAQGGIHAGEVDGKDAGFLLLRQLLAQPAATSLLSQLTFVFVPVFNVDGHEHFGPHQRPNQVGPEQTGWRTNAQRLNLNRDYAKAETPEMQAMLQLLGEWNPILYVDLHVTDGAQFQTDIAVQIEPRLAGSPALRPLGHEVSTKVHAELRRAGLKTVDFYPNFRTADDPMSGFANGVAPPRFSTGYWANRNRFAVLVEAHSWKPYKERVASTQKVLHALLIEAAAQGPRWQKAAQQADQDDLRLPMQTVPLEFAEDGPPQPLQFPGYAFTVDVSPVSGGRRIRYNPSRPQTWQIPFYAGLKAKTSVTAPGFGYLVPPQYAALVSSKLRLHGLRFQVVPEQPAGTAATPQVQAQVFRALSRTFKPEPYEGRQLVEVQGRYQPESVSLQPGSLLVPVAQPGGRLLLHLLEPTGLDSLLAWGFFNAMFEQKEYMEDYVAEEVAEQLLARDQATAAEFQKQLQDPAFARSPAARLRFFYMRHPSFDREQDRYPIQRLDQAPAGLKTP